MKTIKLLLIFIASFSVLTGYSQTTIIPKPNRAEFGEGYFQMNENCVICTNEKSYSNLNYLKNKLVKATGFPFNDTRKLPSDNFISLDFSAGYNIPNEGYLLNISKSSIIIKASSSAGVFYGIQSLLQLLPPTIYSGRTTGHELWRIPVVSVEDSPRFSYRGMMLDVSRTFFDVQTVKKYIDWMSYHKINTFHWHLTDDNGWRIEIKKYPELTNKGAWRGENEVLAAAFGQGNKRYGGFYTQDQIKEIVVYAAQRHIEIIPEIDLPGHSKSVTASYPRVACSGRDNKLSVQGEEQNVWCVGKEQNYKMLEEIIKELSKLFPSKYIHIGGDEVNYSAWTSCPDCQALMEREGMKEPVELLNYFARRMESIVEKHGKHMAGWEEIMDGKDLKRETRVYAWRSVEKGVKSVKKGQPTVMMPSSYCYLDMKQSENERGHNWAGIVPIEKTYSLDPVGTAQLTQEESGLIIGVQGALWAELLGRPQRFLDYQTYPRLCAIAEVGWTHQELRSWLEFNDRLSKNHFERMYQMGIAFRIAPPIVIYENGALKAEAPYPWQVIRYTMDESNPTPYSSIYRGEIFTDKPVKFRFATFYRDELSSIAVKASNVEYEYQKPEFEIETSIAVNNKTPLANLYDYKQDTYVRSSERLKAGDYFTYRFKMPVSSKRITVETGIPNISFYPVTDGYVEYSYNGTDFIKGDEFVNGIAVIYPKEPVMAVRIQVTAPNDGYTAAFQELEID
ncbi:MAG: family 20 glycosylhydrolase [Bacteroidales bacterium]